MQKQMVWYVILSFMMLSDRSCAMFSQQMRRAAPVAGPGLAGMASYAMDPEREDGSSGRGLKGPKISVQMPDLAAVPAKMKDSSLYQSTQAALRNAGNKIENIGSQFEQDLGRLLYSPAEVVDEEKILKLPWSKLTSDAQRVVYLRNSLKDFNLADDVSLHFLARVAGDKSDDRYNYFLKYLKDRDDEIVTLDIVNHYFVHTDFSQTTIFPFNNCLTPVPVSKALLDEWIVNPIMHVNGRQEISIHEMGHALMSVIMPTRFTSYMVTNQAQVLSRGAGGYMQDLERFENDRLYDDQLLESQRLYLDFQNRIMMLLSGGIGMMIFEGKKVSFQEFLALNGTKFGYGIGDRLTKNTDIARAYTLADLYARYKDFALIFDPDRSEVDIQKEVDAVMEEAYEKAYQILFAHKATLDRMAAALQEKKTLQMEEIYQLAGVKRPKMDFEMTLRDKLKRDALAWLNLCAQRIRVYEKHHPDWL